MRRRWSRYIEIEESQKGELVENRMIFRVWAKIEGTASLEARIRLGEKILSTHEKWKENDVDQRIEMKFEPYWRKHMKKQERKSWR